MLGQCRDGFIGKIRHLEGCQQIFQQLDASWRLPGQQVKNVLRQVGRKPLSAVANASNHILVGSLRTHHLKFKLDLSNQHACKGLRVGSKQRGKPIWEPIQLLQGVSESHLCLCCRERLHTRLGLCRVDSQTCQAEQVSTRHSVHLCTFR